MYLYLRIRHFSLQATYSCRIDEYFSKEKDNRESHSFNDVICVKGKIGRIDKVIVDVGSEAKQDDVCDAQP